MKRNLTVLATLFFAVGFFILTGCAVSDEPLYEGTITESETVTESEAASAEEETFEEEEPAGEEISGEGEALEDISAYAGRYESDSNPEDYIEIFANNTFEMVIDGSFTSGSTMITNGTLMLSAGSFSDSMSIGDGVISSFDGVRFIRN